LLADLMNPAREKAKESTAEAKESTAEARGRRVEGSTKKLFEPLNR
jgi:hypothetical protein